MPAWAAFNRIGRSVDASLLLCSSAEAVIENFLTTFFPLRSFTSSLLNTLRFLVFSCTQRHTAVQTFFNEKLNCSDGKLCVRRRAPKKSQDCRKILKLKSFQASPTSLDECCFLTNIKKRGWMERFAAENDKDFCYCEWSE